MFYQHFFFFVRFHPLSEFDEGKRSCRRRLAGHNRRRRKTQPDDATSRLLVPENRDKCGNSEVDIANLLAVLANAQGMKLGKQIDLAHWCSGCGTLMELPILLFTFLFFGCLLVLHFSL